MNSQHTIVIEITFETNSLSYNYNEMQKEWGDEEVKDVTVEIPDSLSVS